jgi:hypothetical protein
MGIKSVIFGIGVMVTTADGLDHIILEQHVKQKTSMEKRVAGQIPCR